MFVMDITTEELFKIGHRTGVVLDVLDNEVLSLHESVNHGQELRRGRLVEADMMEVTTTTTSTTTTTTTTTSTTTTTPDPCLEVVEEAKKTMREEILSQYNLTRNTPTASVTVTEVVTTHTTDVPTTSEHEVSETTTPTINMPEVDEVSLRDVEMITQIVLSSKPVKDVSMEMVTHQSEAGYLFSTIMYKSPQCLRNSKF